MGMRRRLETTTAAATVRARAVRLSVTHLVATILLAAATMRVVLVLAPRVVPAVLAVVIVIVLGRPSCRRWPRRWVSRVRAGCIASWSRRGCRRRSLERAAIGRLLGIPVAHWS